MIRLEHGKAQYLKRIERIPEVEVVVTMDLLREYASKHYNPNWMRYPRQHRVPPHVMHCKLCNRPFKVDEKILKIVYSKVNEGHYHKPCWDRYKRRLRVEVEVLTLDGPAMDSIKLLDLYGWNKDRILSHLQSSFGVGADVASTLMERYYALRLHVGHNTDEEHTK